MNDNNNGNQKWFSSLVYFIVLGCTFYASSAILGFEGEGFLWLQSLLYASITVASIRLGRFGLALVTRSQSRILYTVLVNATGIFLGVVFIMIMRALIPDLTVSIIVVVVASIIAFFILGTISPFFLSDRRASAR